ncbi:MAG: DUF4186 family protein [Candidatus Nanohaloarchaea archaeon]
MRRLELPAREKNGVTLNESDIELVREIGIEGIKQQARQIVEQKLREQPDNDGMQTPMAGNPVYKAMHACRCASRKDLSRAHRIPAGRELSDKEVDAVVNLLTRWIVREHNFFREEVERKQRSLSEF